MKAEARKAMTRKSVNWRKPHELQNSRPIAVVRRSRFEGGTFEIVESPSMAMLAQGFDDKAEAELAALQMNLSRKDKFP